MLLVVNVVINSPHTSLLASMLTIFFFKQKKRGSLFSADFIQAVSFGAIVE
jgi:hypothetical protein